MPESAPATFLAWLRARSNEDLRLLLDRRPDLALPPPLDFNSLAGRAGVRMSIQRSLEQLNTYQLRTLQALCLLSAPRAAESVAQLLGNDDSDAARGALTDLMDLALIWVDESGPRPLAAVAEALGTHIAGLGRPAADLLRATPEHVAKAMAAHLRGIGLLDERDLTAAYADRDWVGQQLAAAPPQVRQTLDVLAAPSESGITSPLGRVRDAYGAALEAVTGSATVHGDGDGDGDGGSANPTRELIARGLLIPIDAGAVELPREVGLALRRYQPWGVVPAEPPAIEPGLSARNVDQSASVEAQTLLRLIEDLADRWAANAPLSLRSGGLGVRDLRRTAKDLAVDETAAALLIEVCAAAGLIGPSAAMPPAWLPTARYDEWLERPAPARWLDIALAWLDMPRRPGLIGTTGQRERTVTPLSPDAGRTTMPAARRQVLGVVGSATPGAAISDQTSVLERLAWDGPLRADELRSLALEVLREAALVGITGAGGLAGFARALLAQDAPRALELLDEALPAPVEEFLVQPDLTVVVPGPPAPDLGRDLRLMAELESSGGAYVFRITEDGLRRALDAGQTPAQLRDFLTDRSRTPIPQALNYLIDDVARRHGSVRVGAVTSYLRCDDPAQLDHMHADRRLASLRLHRLAPTVAVSDASVGELLQVLRDAGFSPMPEDGDGLIVSAGPTAPRAPDRHRIDRVVLRRTSEVELDAVVARLRSSDAILSGAPATPAGVPAIPGVTSARTLEMLRAAIRTGHTVGLAVAESEGTVVARVLEPISLGGGHVRGYDPRAPERLTSYPLHRITSVLDMGPIEANGGGAAAGGADGSADWEDVSGE